MLNRDKIIEKIEYWTAKMDSVECLSKEYNVAKALRCEYRKKLQRLEERDKLLTGASIGTPQRYVTKSTTLEDAIATLIEIEKELRSMRENKQGNSPNNLLGRRRRVIKYIIQKAATRIHCLEERIQAFSI